MNDGVRQATQHLVSEVQEMSLVLFSSFGAFPSIAEPWLAFLLPGLSVLLPVDTTLEVRRHAVWLMEGL